MAFRPQIANKDEEEEEEEEVKLPEEEEELLEKGGTTTTAGQMRYVPLCHVYSATSPCVSASGSSNVMSKKVKARRLLLPDHQQPYEPNPPRPPVFQFYTRRRRKVNPPRYESMVSNYAPPTSSVMKSELVEEEEEGGEVLVKKKKRRRSGCTELINLGIDSTTVALLDGPRLRGSRSCIKTGSVTGGTSIKQQPRQRNCSSSGNEAVNSTITSPSCAKRWVRLKFDGVDPKIFVGLQCKVYWPLDADWYAGRVVRYDPESDRHHVAYEDGDEEDVNLSNERIKFYISPEEMRSLRLSYNLHCSHGDEFDVDEMVVLAASLDDSHDVGSGPGDVIWAKLTGHAMWPGIVLDESLVTDRKSLGKVSGEKSVLVQFFGTHDFARVKMKQVISFLKGLLSSYHLKCKKSDFIVSLEEAKMYLSNQELPKRMLGLRKSIETDCGSASREGDSSDGLIDKCAGDEEIQRKLESLKSCPFKVGDLEVRSLGKIVKNSNCFQDEGFVWTLGYTAMRRFLSLKDPSVYTSYKMEVLRDSGSKTRPLFKVTSDDGEQFEGCSPSACWNEVYSKIRKISVCDASTTVGVAERDFESGADMFGFSHPEVLRLIQGTSDLKLPSKFSNFTSRRYRDMPVGYRPVHVQWKDLDKCNVCHMDEEYENNLFLQCDRCRMMVHARCYGELEPVDGVLWLCNLCRPGAPEVSPPCCLCPVIGGAMKPTTDGRWAHLACAMWIPETCLSDIKKMEPIDGLSRISKDRWKLLCSICGVPYGACIQCSNNACYVAYHPLCARAAGFCAELADEDRLRIIPVDEDEDNQCIRLLSFCKKHGSNPSNGRPATDERIGRTPCQYSDYTPPVNPSGCARSEPYNYFGRRGRKEPEVLAAASLKRSFVENRPYLVGGYSQHDSLGSIHGTSFSFGRAKLKTSQLDASKNIFSMAEKYKYMRKTFKKRLVFGKSGIHGFGIFAKQPQRAGDMVIEYTGELVRPPIADRREHLIYNSLVGAGTYMFRIDDQRVIDATRAGSIAHLINHSCEPNCYSRVISVNGDKHIIIFAKRDIKQWEELTYDYRFFSIDEQLACYCGFSKCRGVVNDIEAEEQVAKIYAPRSELIDWRGE